jgi:aspartyl-tRNA(Asn)/glutamyl-tRNA(Gln) amidotransferase subunit C
MPVTIQDVERVAALAHLDFSAEEKVKLTAELNTILTYMDQLNRLDTSSVEPLAQVVQLQNVVREDLLVPGFSREEALKNAPAKTGAFFKVPKVIGDR